MSRLLKAALFLLAVLLSGAVGFSATLLPVPAARSAAVQLDVDLREKTRETEPEEYPSATDIEVEVVRRERDPDTPLRVLIYHTHTYEAYEPDFEGQYKPTERWRTADADYNVVRVGAEIARILREEYGMAVVHDDTAFEPPRLDTAYQRSLEALENYTARGETFDLYLDVHRDAFASGAFAQNTVSAAGAPAARLMLLIGDGSGTFAGQAFAQKPDWAQNLLRAQRITDAVNAMSPELCRPVTVKTGRYNQHVSTGALLAEVGNNMNSLEEALAAAGFLARAIGETLGGSVPYIQNTVQGK